MKKVIRIISLISILFLFPLVVKANSINKIDMFFKYKIIILQIIVNNIIVTFDMLFVYNKAFLFP